MVMYTRTQTAKAGAASVASGEDGEGATPSPRISFRPFALPVCRSSAEVRGLTGSSNGNDGESGMPGASCGGLSRKPSPSWGAGCKAALRSPSVGDRISEPPAFRVGGFMNELLMLLLGFLVSYEVLVLCLPLLLHPICLSIDTSEQADVTSSCRVGLIGTTNSRVSVRSVPQL
eukprot:Hpha_TRINITY_DN35196_c0_g1::TRINITY_DN35196_c0_g1_i1::g.168431::m.168431